MGTQLARANPARGLAGATRPAHFSSDRSLRAETQGLSKSVEVHWFDAGHLGAGTEDDVRNFELML
ncbi:MAG: hypothetical protein A4E19_05340 [Nitrospira sp. SG-bin1]|nr:MAG: hypothetical protein A4E19_05340 [Nitrospira sp. SG-bin1]